MNDDLRTETVTREGFLKLLSDAERARVSTAYVPAPLANGDEDLDLEHSAQGAGATDQNTPMDPALPTRALHELTWNKVLMKLTPSVPRPHLPSPYLRLVKTTS